MDPIFDLVKELEPDIAPPTAQMRDRQRALLVREIRSGSAEGGHPSRDVGRQFRGLRRAPVIGAVVAGLALTGAGVAAAVTLASPTPQQARSIYHHYYPSGGAGHTSGSRPTLNSEEVLCDYRGATALPPDVRDGLAGDAFASSAPLTTPLTARMLVDACFSVASTGAIVPPSTPATLCATSLQSSVTDTPAGWPVVVFGTSTCSGSGDVMAPADLLAQVNQRRDAEANLDAVPQTCPTEAEAVTWVHDELTTLGLNFQVAAWDGGPGGSCYLPFVQWWSPGTGAPVVQVTASQQSATPGTTPPTPPTP